MIDASPETQRGRTSGWPQYYVFIPHFRPGLRLCAALAAATMLALAAGCGRTPALQPASSPAAVASAATSLNHIAVEYNQVTGVEIPVWVAQDAGIFRKNGLDVDLELIESNKGIPSLISGEVQFADPGGSQVLGAVAGGADLVEVAVMGPVYPFVFVAAPSITSVEELKGARVGITGVSTSDDIATRLALRQEGPSPESDVNLIVIGSVQNRAAALLGGAIDAAVTVPPETSTVTANGFHTLFDLADLQLPASLAAVTVQRSFLESNRSVVQSYVSSLVEAIARARRDKAFTVQVLERYFGSSDDQAMGSVYDYYVGKIIPSLPFPRTEQLVDTQTMLATDNARVSGVNLASMMDASFVQNAADNGVGP